MKSWYKEIPQLKGCMELSPTEWLLENIELVRFEMPPSNFHTIVWFSLLSWKNLLQELVLITSNAEYQSKLWKLLGGISILTYSKVSKNH